MHSNRQGPEHGMRPDERKKKTMKEYFAYGSNLNLGQMAGRVPGVYHSSDRTAGRV